VGQRHKKNVRTEGSFAHSGKSIRIESRGGAISTRLKEGLEREEKRAFCFAYRKKSVGKSGTVRNSVPSLEDKAHGDGGVSRLPGDQK